MILQALTEYYARKGNELPQYGFETKTIPIIIEINQQGELVQIRKEDKDSAAAQYWVPQGVKKTSGIASCLLWDNAEYALGITAKSQPERAAEQHQAFKEKILSLGADAIEEEAIQALLRFFEKLNPETFKDHPYWDYLLTNPYVSFRLQGDSGLICQREAIRAAVLKKQEITHPALCLASGEMDETERLHSSIKGVWGAQSAGANIVSFNLDAFNSYGKSQGFNAPVGKHASFAYTTALNYLLRKGSEQRAQIGDASTVFWSKKPTHFENDFAALWGTTVKEIHDDPDKYSEIVKAVCGAPHRGNYIEDESDVEFYVLGLSPNAARISIRFWITGKIGEFSGRIKLHFDDLEMIHSDRDIEALPLYLLLVNVAVQGKSDNIPPNLAGEVMRSILTGRPYPFTLFAAAVRRCKAEQNVNYSRAAIIKAYLNRFNQNEEITVALDKNNVNSAYRLGRLFAALEKIQEEAHNEHINSTIRDRYYGAASSNPITVFPTLLKLTNHHLNKLENRGRKTNFEKLLGDIIDPLQPEFPAAFSIQDQGRFAVGYYHQRQDFFTKKPSNESGEQL